MKKRNFFSSGFATKTNYLAGAMEAAKTLPKIRMDMTQDQYAALLKGVLTYKDTPLGEIFSSIVSSSKPQLLHMSFLSTPDDVPEVLQMAQLSICGAEIMPSLASTAYGKVWNPLSTAMHRNRTTGDISVGSENVIIETTVRSQLCQNFFNRNDPWLNSTDMLFVANLYGDFMAASIARPFGLTIQEEMPVKFIFAWYFMLLCSVPTEKDGSMPLCRRLGNISGLTAQAIDKLTSSMIDMYATTEQEPQLVDIVEVVKEFSPDRVSRLTAMSIYSIMLNSTSDGIPVAICVDYPPYFMAFLLNVASIGRHVTLTKIIKERNRPSDVMRELRRMSRSGGFYA